MVTTCRKSGCKPWGLPERHRITRALSVYLCKKHASQLTHIYARCGLGVKRPLTDSERLILWQFFQTTRYFDTQKRLSSHTAKLLLHLLSRGKYISDATLLRYRAHNLARHSATSCSITAAPQTAIPITGDIKSWQRVIQHGSGQCSTESPAKGSVACGAALMEQQAGSQPGRARDAELRNSENDRHYEL
jgi:hypothetical protein